ncbi:MAG: YdiU family protein [Gammaproteobacteria bacterium]|nr:YdiU family protein [Gammaproteobacteria bacterium]
MNPFSSLRLQHSYTQLPEHFYARQPISPLRDVRLASFNPQAAALLGLAPEVDADELIAGFNGQTSLNADAPIACLYAGHQFGHYVQQLGDGRALLLGEHHHPEHGVWELQLKGGGATPFSRMGDGRAVLRSTIREYLCSEAMHGLGIPTTRALAMFDSETPVIREQVERGALLVRMAPSHVRFGSFQVFYYRDQHDDLKLLADYVIDRHYAELRDAANPYLALLQTVVERTAKLIAQWQAVGFAHGVMNTDNMSILGLTLDYGPFGFLDEYEPGFICNHSDHTGRYAFDQQPNIGAWNCSALAQALLPLMELDDAKAALSQFAPSFENAYAQLMLQKLGLRERNPQNSALVDELLKIMADNQRDYSDFFHQLSTFDSSAPQHALRDTFLNREQFDAWAKNYQAALQQENSVDAERATRMRQVNPKFVLRNYLAQQAIEKAEMGDYSQINELLQVLQSPFAEHEEFNQFAQLPPDWARKISVSCSS